LLNNASEVTFHRQIEQGSDFLCWGSHNESAVRPLSFLVLAIDATL
jgi:hypothetical protein